MIRHGLTLAGCFLLGAAAGLAVRLARLTLATIHDHAGRALARLEG